MCFVIIFSASALDGDVVIIQTHARRRKLTEDAQTQESCGSIRILSAKTNGQECSSFHANELLVRRNRCVFENRQDPRQLPRGRQETVQLPPGTRIVRARFLYDEHRPPTCLHGRMSFAADKKVLECWNFAVFVMKNRKQIRRLHEHLTHVRCVERSTVLSVNDPCVNGCNKKIPPSFGIWDFYFGALSYLHILQDFFIRSATAEIPTRI